MASIDRRWWFVGENFDATQFITFDTKCNCDYITTQLQEKFGLLGFEVLNFDKIRSVKKRYFNQYQKEVFIELKDETFFGEIELWNFDEEEPSDRIQKVSEILFWLKSQDGIGDVSFILTGFAEEGVSTTDIIKVNSTKIVKGISMMSKYSFDVWTDNLIIEIV